MGAPSDSDLFTTLMPATSSLCNPITDNSALQLNVSPTSTPSTSPIISSSRVIFVSLILAATLICDLRRLGPTSSTSFSMKSHNFWNVSKVAFTSALLGPTGSLSLSFAGDSDISSPELCSSGIS
ncbi:hypothetical protein Mapa_001348 [Marchantia paleacea]|nr:hypothetical protein Mapa_001348 [Marchantia paleacea]